MFSFKYSSLIQYIKSKVKEIKFQAIILWMACKNQGTPLLVKFIALFVLAYALSPIDLIPDFIPILGYLDELILLPILITLAIQFLPKDIYDLAKASAQAWHEQRTAKPISKMGWILIPFTWLILFFWIYRFLSE